MVVACKEISPASTTNLHCSAVIAQAIEAALVLKLKSTMQIVTAVYGDRNMSIWRTFDFKPNMVVLGVMVVLCFPVLL